MKYCNHAFFNSLEQSESKQTVVSWPGFLYGDGLSSNKLYCIHKRKTSEVTITKCLFRIEPAKKYHRKKELQEFGYKASESKDTSFKQFNEALRFV